MMEERLNKIETQVAVIHTTQQSMAVSLDRISHSLEKISATHTEVKLLMQESQSHDKRITKLETIVSKVAWIIATPIIAGMLALVITKG